MTTVTLPRQPAIELLTELGDTDAAANAETVGRHVNCAGHTVFLPSGGTLGLRYRDGAYEITC